MSYNNNNNKIVFIKLRIIHEHIELVNIFEGQRLGTIIVHRNLLHE